MAYQISTALQNLLADALGDAMNSGSLEIYDAGSGVPADANEAISDQTLLANVTLPADCFAAAASGQVALSGTWEDGDVDASGTAAFFRLKDSGGTQTLQGTITATGGGGDMEIDDVNLVAGGTFTVTGFTVTMPA